MKIAFSLRGYYGSLYGKVTQYLLANHFPAAEMVAVFGDNADASLHGKQGTWVRTYCLAEELKKERVFEADSARDLDAMSVRYGAGLAGLIQADRYLSLLPHKQLLKKLVGYARFFERFMETEQPDCLILCELALAFELLALRVARRAGVPALVPVTARLPYHRIAFNTDVKERWLGLKQCYEQKRSTGLNTSERKQIQGLIDDIALARKSPVYKGVDRKWSTVGMRIRELARLREYGTETWAYFWRDRGYTHYQYWPALKRKGARTIRYYWSKLLSHYDTPDGKDKYFLFPLQVYPEYSLQVLAPYAANQVAVIENVAKCLPLGYLLYVKENEAALGWRSAGFYRSLKKLPNVKLIPPGTCVHGLIEDCVGIITISATTGLEGIVMDKPVITLGEPFYNEFEEVMHPCGYEALASSVDKIVRKGFAYSPNRLLFLYAILASSYPGQIVFPFYMPYSQSESNLADLASALATVVSGTLSARTEVITD